PDTPTSDARTSDTPATGAPTSHARTSEPVAEQPHAMPDSSLQGAVREQPEGSPPRARTDTTRIDNTHPHTTRTDDVAPERERDRPEARPPGGTE
ncbi:hypothetical protein, partial [Streptomyces buecherae]|uniref:hypothetical protein n=1 Tax=Streptomyces buecherae TaxID=2763006 RepID=UPI0036F2F736